MAEEQKKVWKVRTLIPQRNIYHVIGAATGLEAWQMVQHGADCVEYQDTEPFIAEEEEMISVEEITAETSS